MNWIGTVRNRRGSVKANERRRKAFFERKRYVCRSSVLEDFPRSSFSNKDRSRDLVHLECITGMKLPRSITGNPEKDEISVGSSGDVLYQPRQNTHSSSGHHSQNTIRKDGRKYKESIYLPNASPVREPSRLEFADTENEDCMDLIAERPSATFTTEYYPHKLNILPARQSTLSERSHDQKETTAFDHFFRQPQNEMDITLEEPHDAIDGESPVGLTAMEVVRLASLVGEQRVHRFGNFASCHAFGTSSMDLHSQHDVATALRENEFPPVSHKHEMFQSPSDESQNLFYREGVKDNKHPLHCTSHDSACLDGPSMSVEAPITVSCSAMDISRNTTSTLIEFTSDGIIPNLLAGARNLGDVPLNDENIPMIESFDKSQVVNLHPIRPSLTALLSAEPNSGANLLPFVNLEDGLPRPTDDSDINCASRLPSSQTSQPDLNAVCSSLKAYQEFESKYEPTEPNIHTDKEYESKVECGRHGGVHGEPPNKSQTVCVDFQQTSASISVVHSTPLSPPPSGHNVKLNEQHVDNGRPVLVDKHTSLSGALKNAVTQTLEGLEGLTHRGTQTDDTARFQTSSRRMRRRARLQKAATI